MTTRCFDPNRAFVGCKYNADLSKVEEYEGSFAGRRAQYASLLD